MSVPKLRHVLTVATILGITVAITIYLAVSGGGLAPDEVIYVWPSAIMLMATETLGQSIEAYLILAASVALNGVLYMCIALVAWLPFWLLGSAARRPQSAREV